MAFESQHPAQLAPEHPPPLLLVLDPLPEPLPDPPPDPPPPSSAGIPLPLPLGLVYDIESSEPLELALLLVLDPLPVPLIPEEEEGGPARSHLAAPGGAGSPAAHDIARMPTPSTPVAHIALRTSLPTPTRVRGAAAQTRPHALRPTRDV